VLPDFAARDALVRSVEASASVAARVMTLIDAGPVWEAARWRRVAPRRFEWDGGNSADVRHGYVCWKIRGCPDTWQTLSELTDERLDGMLILSRGRAPIPEHVRRALYEHLGYRAQKAASRVALANAVLAFARTNAGAARPACESCELIPQGGLASTLEKVERMEVFLVPANDDTDATAAANGETDHVRRCPACGQLYAWTYQYEFLVGGSETTVFAYKVDLAAAAVFITERLWRSTGAMCVHPPSGRSVG